MLVITQVLKREWDYLLCRKLNYLVSKLETREQQQRFLEEVEYDVMAAIRPGRRKPFLPDFEIHQYRSTYKDPKNTPACQPSFEKLGDCYTEFVDSNMTRAKILGVSFNGIVLPKESTLDLVGSLWPLPVRLFFSPASRRILTGPSPATPQTLHHV